MPILGLDISGMPSLSAGEGISREREGEEDGWQEIRGAIHKQQEGWKKARCEGKKSKKMRQKTRKKSFVKRDQD